MEILINTGTYTMRTSPTNSHFPVYLALWSVDGMPVVTSWHPLLCSTNLWSISHQTPFSLFSCSALYSRGAEPCRLGFPGSRVCRLLLVSTNGRHCGETGGWKAGKFRAFAPPISLSTVSLSAVISTFMASAGEKQVCCGSSLCLLTWAPGLW